MIRLSLFVLADVAARLSRAGKGLRHQIELSYSAPRHEFVFRGSYFAEVIIARFFLLPLVMVASLTLRWCFIHCH